MPSISLGRKEQLYVVAENSYGAAAAPDGAGAIKHLSSRFEVKEERADRADRSASRGLADRVPGKRNVSWSVEGYLMPSGTGGTPPDFDGLLACSFDRRVTVATTVAANPTTTGATLADATGLQAGDFVGFELSGTLYAARLAAVDTATGAVTWWPALPAPPQVGDTAHPAVGSRLQTEPQGSATIHRLLDREAQVATGCVPNEWTFAVAAGDPAKVTASGPGQDLVFAGTAALAAAMDATQTSFFHAGNPQFEPGTWVQLDQEVLRITAVDVDTNECTVSRAQCGTAAAAHALGAVAAPYRPTPTTAGAPIAGVTGRCQLLDVSVPITAAKASITENVSLLNTLHGSAVAQDYHYPQRRQVQLEVEALLTAETAGALVMTKLQDDTPFFLQAGHTSGRTFVCYAPRFQPEIPSLEAPVDDVIPLSLAGPALEDDGQDEIQFAFL